MMPLLFIGHGSPLNALEDNEFSRGWIALGKTLPTPKAILVISAHWETDGTFVTAMPRPKTIHDFGGFPEELFNMQYPAPGSPDLASQISQMIPSVGLDYDWGLDHGAWSVLARLFPQANIPVVEFSLDTNLSPRKHFDLAASLLPLRDQGVLIIGSGNLVHNLGIINWQGDAFDWAIDFDSKIKKFISARDFSSLIDYPNITNANLAIPTNEHYLPLLYTLALTTPKDQINIFNEKITLGSISMTSLSASILLK